MVFGALASPSNPTLPRRSTWICRNILSWIDDTDLPFTSFEKNENKTSPQFCAEGDRLWCNRSRVYCCIYRLWQVGLTQCPGNEVKLTTSRGLFWFLQPRSSRANGTVHHLTLGMIWFGVISKVCIHSVKHLRREI